VNYSAYIYSIKERVMKKLFLVFSIVVSSFGFGQDYGDSLVTKDFVSVETIEYWMIRYINAERLKLGLDTLVLDSELDKMANDHSAWMSRTGKYEHSGKNVYEVIMTSGFAGNKYASTLHKNTASGCVRAWMSSPGHNYIITKPELKYIGSGFSYSIRNGDGYITVYYTVTVR
jgi:uncharacterized protein YkwD